MTVIHLFSWQTGLLWRRSFLFPMTRPSTWSYINIVSISILWISRACHKRNWIYRIWGLNNSVLAKEERIFTKVKRDEAKVNIECSWYWKLKLFSCVCKSINPVKWFLASYVFNYSHTVLHKEWTRSCVIHTKMWYTGRCLLVAHLIHFNKWISRYETIMNY